ncbi:MAG: hypothetical protein Mars2KO_44520 [Maribacter sp.]
MSKKDKFLYSLGIVIFIFVSFILLRTQLSLENKISNQIELKNNIPQLEQTMLRYEYSSKILLSNATRKNIAFLIGTMMVVLGTILIISKIESSIDAKVDTIEKAKVHITTSSPGVFIVLLGTIIVVATILKSDSYQFEDYPIESTEDIFGVGDRNEESSSENSEERDDSEKVKGLLKFN